VPGTRKIYLSSMVLLCFYAYSLLSSHLMHQSHPPIFVKSNYSFQEKTSERSSNAFTVEMKWLKGKDLFMSIYSRE
jgi:hypothetical protein